MAEPILMRGMELRDGNWKIQEGGVLLHRLKMLGDMTFGAAEGLGIQDEFYDCGVDEKGKPTTPKLKDFGRNEISVSGKITAAFAEIDPPTMSANKLALNVSELIYEAYTKAGKDDSHPPEARIALTLLTTDPFERVELYGRICGTVGSVVKVFTEAQPAQMKLGDTAEPAVASAGEMKRKSRGKDAAAGVQ